MSEKKEVASQSGQKEEEEVSKHEGTFENNKVKEEKSDKKEKIEIEEDEMDKKEFTIPMFDGEDYGMWKKRITMFLKLKKMS